MAKAKLGNFKKFIKSLDEAEKEAELVRLFKALPAVKEFYAQELGDTEALESLLAEKKLELESMFFAPNGQPKLPNGMRIRQLLKAFEKSAVFQFHVADLYLTHTELVAQLFEGTGGIPEVFIKSAFSSLKKAMKITNEESLNDYFDDRLKKLKITDLIQAFDIDLASL